MNENLYNCLTEEEKRMNSRGLLSLRAVMDRFDEECFLEWRDKINEVKNGLSYEKAFVGRIEGEMVQSTPNISSTCSVPVFRLLEKVEKLTGGEVRPASLYLQGDLRRGVYFVAETKDKRDIRLFFWERQSTDLILE